MKIKFYYAVIILFLFLAANKVSGQIPVRSTYISKDNFTSFTSEKKYVDIDMLKALTPPAFYNHPDFGKCFTDSIQWYEQIDKRTLKSRTYKGHNNEIIVEYGYDNINYTDVNGWLRAVDTKLKPFSGGWAAPQQEIPVYLYHDGSTAFSLGGNSLMLFNKNVQFNHSGVSVNNYTVGDNGMYIKDAAPNADKIIRFGRGRVETDYKISQPLKLSDDLIISEDIILPPGYTISVNENYNSETTGTASLIVTGSDGKVAAKIKSPFCYDKYGSSVSGTYHFQKQNGGYRLETDIPSAWLNDPMRQYPVTIDPVIEGPTSLYSGAIIGSCIYPDFDTASIDVIIPAAVTVTNFYVQGDYYAPVINISHGYFYFQTSCMDTPLVYAGNTVAGSNTPGWIFAPLSENDLVPNGATSCYSPSCSPQIIRLVMGIARDTIDTAGCNARYLYYDPANTDGYPFEAYVVGHTIETSTDTGWVLSPTPFCENTCSMIMNVTTNYGVPPYTISHPWSSDTITYGKYNDSLNESKGDTFLILTIPSCSDTNTLTTKIYVYPPIITDVCGNKVTGLPRKQVTLNPAPRPAFGYVEHGNTVTFSDSSLDATSWKWEFGDGSSNSLESPTYTYNSAGIYTVTLVVSNGTCIDSITKTINVNTGIAGVNGQNTVMHIYPNPAGNSTTVEFTIDEHDVQLTLVNVLGQTLYSEILKPATGNNYRTNLDLSALPGGVYEIVLATSTYNVATEIIKQE